ncbi:MAG: hypothetical protein KA712_24300 [Myxococcales bacterium]|nr:hypothetical protein [Myxococcales bacterium]
MRRAQPRSRLAVFVVALTFGGALSQERAWAAPRSVRGTWNDWYDVTALAQTTDGFVYLASESGLARFDGVRFVNLSRNGNAALAGQRARALLATPDGALLVGLAGGAGVLRLQGDSVDVWAGPERLGGLSVDRLAADGQGGLWLGTNEGLRRLRGPRVEVPSQGPKGQILSLAVDAAGHAWAGVIDGLWRVTEAGATEVAHGRDVRALVAQGRSIWASVGDDVYRLEGNDLALPPSPLFTTPLRQAAVLGLDPLGHVIVGGNRTLSVFIDGALEPLASPARAADSARALLTAQDGAVVVASDGGEVRLLGPALVETLAAGRAGEPNVVFSALETEDGLWVASAQGLLLQRPGGALTPVPLRSHCPRSLARTQDGRLWLGTCDEGLFSWNGHSWQNEDVGESHLHLIMPAHEGGLWVTLRRGGLLHVEGKNVRRISGDAPPCPEESRSACLSTFHALAELPAGVFAGSRRGLFRVEGTRLLPVPLGRPVEVLSLLPDREGGLWMGTWGHGLLRWRNGHLQGVAASAGLGSERVHTLGEEGTARLWFTSERGVARLEHAALDALFSGRTSYVQALTFDERDGMLTPRTSFGHQPRLIFDQEGALLVPSADGLIRVPPMAPSPFKVERPALRFEHVEVNDTVAVIPAGRTLERPSGAGNLTVRFTAPVLAFPHRARFRYRLEGHDHDWVLAGPERTARYAGLSPGTYAFRVTYEMAESPAPARELSLLLTLRAWHQRIELYVGGAVASLVLALAFQRLRLRQQRTRFELILDERNRIARDLHDSLAQAFTGIGFQIDRLSRHLVAGPPQVKGLLDQLRTMVNHGRYEARQVIWNLRAQSGAERSLSSSLEDMVATVATVSDAHIEVNVQGDEPALQGPLLQALLHIAQEAITNALAHGQAHRVQLEVLAHEPRLSLVITDDGLGFDPGEVGQDLRPHFGLQGMKERTEHIGATLTVDSQPGRGTVIRVDLETGSAMKW